MHLTKVVQGIAVADPESQTMVFVVEEKADG